jgi:hypothetical protein
MISRDLVSKLLAAGLSAGVFLIWWPQHHPTTGLASLIVRGALWTLAFELLLLAFAPLERHVTRALSDRVAVRRKLEVRIGGACVLACAGAALPLALLAGAHAPLPARAHAHVATQPKRIVVVKRQKVVVKREVVTVPAPAAASHPAPPIIRTKVVRVPAEKTVTTKAKTTSKPAPAPAAATTTTPQPAAATTATPAPAPDGVSSP